MMKSSELKKGKSRCLADDDFYAVLTRPPGQPPPGHIEAHLAGCDHCRRELAELIKMLYPEGREDLEPETSEQEIEETLTLIQETARPGQTVRAGGMPWYKWGAIAAAAVVTLGLSSVGALFLYERGKSQSFCDQARTSLENVYAPQSPNDLRLDLPFKPAVSQRSSAGDDALGSAEKSFNRALGVREGMREALLGIGYIELRRGQYSKAQEAFNGVVAVRKGDLQALLGRGVSRFEEALNVTDPLLRDTRLHGALEDFDGVLHLKPESNEARYDKIRALYELGRHKDALAEIDAYLARDTDSIWAVKLRSLKTSILMTRSEAIDAEVYRAAKARDAPALVTLAQVVPHKVLPALRSITIDSIAFEKIPETPDKPSVADLQWAARVLADAYSAVTGDRSYEHLFEFYAGLGAQERETKRALDVRLELLVGRFRAGDAQSGMRESEQLVQGFKRLGDDWELVRTHQFRAAVLTYARADFAGATTEFQLMLEAAERSEDPDLIARSLAALGNTFIRRERYDEGLRLLTRLKALAQAKHMEQWVSWSAMALGNVYLTLNQLEDGLREFSASLAAAYHLADSMVQVTSVEELAASKELMGKYKEAEDLYKESGRLLDVSVREGSLETTPEVRHTRVRMLSRRGYLALKMSEPVVAEKYFKEGISASGGSMPQLTSYSRLGLAKAYSDEGRVREANIELDAVLGTLAANDFPDLAWQANSLKGQLLARAGSKAEAIARFRRAESILGQMRRNVSSPDLRLSFYARRFDPSREAVSLLYDLNKNPMPSLEQVDLAKGTTLREYLEFGTRRGSQSAQPFWATHGGLAAPLPQGIVTLEYFLSSDRVLAFVSGHGGVESVSLNVRESDLSAEVAGYADSIRRNDGAAFDVMSRKLHRQLVDPLLPLLARQQIETLVIIPDGPLHLLPFGSLTDSKGRFLLEQFTLSYAPTRSILQYCLGMNKTMGFTTKSAVLLLDGRSSLAGASQELAHLANVFSAGTQLVSSADLPKLGMTVSDFEIIHFAGHASISRGRPRLVFSTPRGDAYLEAATIESWKLKSNRLVSLIGCDTGIGPLFEGETPWGLLPAFLKAGTPALLASLMAIDDASAEVLTTQFYSLLSSGSISKARALREAQLSLLQDLGSQVRTRPGAWAPYVLVGDPR